MKNLPSQSSEGVDIERILSKTNVRNGLRVQLINARAEATRNSESFDAIVHVVERIGSILNGKTGDLGKYRCHLVRLAEHSPLSTCLPSLQPDFHSSFARLFEIVRDGRNSAVHSGAMARNLTKNAIELCLILEDVMTNVQSDPQQSIQKVSDRMVRDPICAELWHPISFARQRMLVNSFSYLPVKKACGTWSLVSDQRIAKFLHCQSSQSDRGKALAKMIGDEPSLLEDVDKPINCDESIQSIIDKVSSKPILVQSRQHHNEIIGIITAFDLL